MRSSAVSLFPLLNSRPQYPLARAAGLFTWQNANLAFPLLPDSPFEFLLPNVRERQYHHRYYRLNPT